MGEDLKTKIGFISMGEGMWADNLGIALCTYFSDHPERPEDDPEDTDSGWGEWVERKMEETLDKIVAICTSKDAEREKSRMLVTVSI